MLDIGQFTDHVIQPALETLGLYSKAAEQLLLGTALQESRLTYLRQVGGGPALGLFQMEPATHDDIWHNYLDYRPELASRVSILVSVPIAQSLTANMWYAAAMARVHYRRVPAPLPEEGDIEAMAAYWKQHYNSQLGAGQEHEFVANWERYAGGTE